MHVLILADALFASRERSLLSRLEIGLADEGVRVLHAIPESASRSGHSLFGGEVFTRAVTYPDRAIPFTTGLRSRVLLGSIAKALQADELPDIDVVHVFGGSAWPLGLDLARRAGAGVVLEVWRSGLVSQAGALRLRGHGDVLLAAPDSAVERALLAEGSGSTVRLTQWGVYTPPEPRQVLRDGRAPALMMIGTGLDARAVHAFLSGVAEATKVAPDLLVFADALTARRSGAWAIAGKLGLRDRLSLIEELESRRDLLVQGDIIAQPEARGEQRSVILEAMAAGMAVVAAADPMVHILQGGVTCRLAPSHDASAWGRVLSEMLTNREATRELARRGREHIREQRRASDHVRSVLAAYHWLNATEPLQFAAKP
ncbi:MAG: glycosyltransferase [Planctomycetota bacterium]|nr:glycosyltransferase [Planctomycetota bacterium]